MEQESSDKLRNSEAVIERVLKIFGLLEHAFRDKIGKPNLAHSDEDNLTLQSRQLCLVGQLVQSFDVLTSSFVL